eukprot:COSAG05_NODE_1224_length_5470_cov_4.161140_5_plen_80_part_00
MGRRAGEHREDSHDLCFACRYHKLLGRDPDATAAKAFSDLIADPQKTLSITDMTADMLHSDEFGIVYLATAASSNSSEE